MAMSQGIATTPTKRRIVGGVDGTLAAIPVLILRESEPISRVFGTLSPFGIRATGSTAFSDGHPRPFPSGK